MKNTDAAERESHEETGVSWKNTGLGVETTVPILDGRGEGTYEISITPRPSYCDRGDWLILVDGRNDIDGADGFPRYFFGTLNEAKTQMGTWLNRRRAFRDYVRH